MGSIIDRAKAHYAALPPQEIKVPEWGEPGKPLVVTWKKMTVRDERRIYAPVEGRPVDGGTARLRTVIFKALDANGARLFDEMDEHALCFEVDAGVLARVANAILFGDGLTDIEGEPKSLEERVDTAKKP